jgi:hypothetical protein
MLRIHTEIDKNR